MKALSTRKTKNIRAKYLSIEILLRATSMKKNKRKTKTISNRKTITL